MELLIYLIYGNISTLHRILPTRLMVGHIPLEDGIGVRVPGRQQIRTSSKSYNLNEYKHV